jgi:hypothetical protein
MKEVLTEMLKIGLLIIEFVLLYWLLLRNDMAVPKSICGWLSKYLPKEKE